MLEFALELTLELAEELIDEDGVELTEEVLLTDTLEFCDEELAEDTTIEELEACVEELLRVELEDAPGLLLALLAEELSSPEDEPPQAPSDRIAAKRMQWQSKFLSSCFFIAGLDSKP